jgi:hypothetical protein
MEQFPLTIFEPFNSDIIGYLKWTAIIDNPNIIKIHCIHIKLHKPYKIYQYQIVDWPQRKPSLPQQPLVALHEDP